MLHLFLSSLLFFSCMPSQSISFFGYFKARRDYSREGEIAQFDRELNDISPKNSLSSEKTTNDSFMNSPEQRKLHKKPRGHWVARTSTYKLNNRFKFAVSKIPHYSNKIARLNTAYAQYVNIPVIENKECSLEELEEGWSYKQPINVYLKNGYKLDGIQHNDPSIVLTFRSRNYTKTIIEKVREEDWVKDFPVDPEEWTPKL